ncbi:MAG: hypothetical protein LUC30_07410 [Clostridiales bacterium]|nr:hypothetical protein [Clostridiales bacterium]
MELTLSLGGRVFLIQVDREMPVDRAFRPFQVPFSAAPDVTVTFRWSWGNEEKPRGVLLGRDVLLDHYETEGCRWAFARGRDDYQSCARCSPGFDRVDCCINGALCRPERVNLATLMRFLPMAAILGRLGAFVLHSSQICWRDRGIVFSAPSGTGKTTQAKLWCRERGAELLCNDRTLLFQRDGVWKTCGYPLDGSEPVYSNRVTELGCIVLLQQGKKCEVRRLRAGQALAGLLSQVQADVWNGRSGAVWTDRLAVLLENVPVYQYVCTPLPEAVDELERVLTEEGVFFHGDHS